MALSLLKVPVTWWFPYSRRHEPPSAEQRCAAYYVVDFNIFVSQYLSSQVFLNLIIAHHTIPEHWPLIFKSKDHEPVLSIKARKSSSDTLALVWWLVDGGDLPDLLSTSRPKQTRHLRAAFSTPEQWRTGVSQGAWKAEHHQPGKGLFIDSYWYIAFIGHR